MKKILLISLLFLTRNAFAQVIKLDNGLLFSSFHNKENLSILSSEKIVSYSGLLGIDYLEKNWFYLSSQVGYVRLGGKETNPSLPDEYRNVAESQNFVHLNTVFRAYTKTSGLKVFGGVGPYINVLTGAKQFDSQLYKPYYEFKRFSVGGKAEAGVTQDVNKFRVGFIGTYTYSLTPVAASDYLPLVNNTFSVGITVGYHIH